MGDGVRCWTFSSPTAHQRISAYQTPRKIIINFIYFNISCLALCLSTEIQKRTNGLADGNECKIFPASYLIRSCPKDILGYIWLFYVAA